MKPFEDLGHAVRLTKPIRVKRYEMKHLPDPGQCVDCLIVVNDRSDGQPRARLALSNGASWDMLGYLDDAPSHVPSQSVAVRPTEIDLTPLVRQAVEAALPGMIPPAVKVIESRANVPDDTLQQLQAADRVTSQALIEFSEHINSLLRDRAEMMARIEYLETHAIAKVGIKGAA